MKIIFGEEIFMRKFIVILVLTATGLLMTGEKVLVHPDNVLIRPDTAWYSVETIHQGSGKVVGNLYLNWVGDSISVTRVDGDKYMVDDNDVYPMGATSYLSTKEIHIITVYFFGRDSGKIYRIDARLVPLGKGKIAVHARCKYPLFRKTACEVIWYEW
jgi:hypothetical protein